MAEQLFDRITRGIEKENLRVSRDGQLSFKPHPNALGKTLTHPSITTDFAESLPEIITSPLEGRDNLFNELNSINAYLTHHLEDEVLWPLSMPPQILSEDDIQIADYGQSHIGQLKHLYRVGLTHRYGKMMQVIAGIHYNFSFPEAFFSGHDQSSAYFILLRNFYRHYWLLPYLFGASPACDNSLLAGRTCQTGLDRLDPNTLAGEYATSLRMSDIGYQNQAQSSIVISTDDVKSYSKSLIDAINTPYPPFANIKSTRDGCPNQINHNLLQIENEYYSPIRPKQIAQSGEHPTRALCKRGVRYIEVRVLDLNPFTPLGVTQTQSAFMDVFLTYCAKSNPNNLSSADFTNCKANFKQAVCHGRDPRCELTIEGKTISLQDAGFELFQKLEVVAKQMDERSNSNEYLQALEAEREKLEDPAKTPSELILNLMSSEGFSHQALGQYLAKTHFSEMDEVNLTQDFIRVMDQAARQSTLDERELLTKSTGYFAEYLAMFNRSL